MPFSPNSSLLTENNARNIKYMAGSILCERLDLRKISLHRQAPGSSFV